MQTVVENVRTGVMSALHTLPEIRASLANPDKVAEYVNRTRVRIPGMPRGSWAGISRDAPAADFESGDGVFVMAAKQARTLWLDRQRSLVYNATSPCDGPSVLHPLTANAYIFPEVHCAFYLLGMATRPFADELYDDAAMHARFGYMYAPHFHPLPPAGARPCPDPARWHRPLPHVAVSFRRIAHELAHNNVNTAYNSDGVKSLLQDYPCAASTRDEAFADVLASLGVLNTKTVDREQLCQHISQLWCARASTTAADCNGHSHPGAVRARVPPLLLRRRLHGHACMCVCVCIQNLRGDALCSTLRRLA
jgi:hypothetical protein